MQILKIIALLIEYPDETLWENREEALSLIEQDAPMLLSFARQHLSAPLLDKQAEWCEVFERGRATSLLLFEHVHAESRDRGQAMVDLMGQYEKPGYSSTAANCRTICRSIWSTSVSLRTTRRAKDCRTSRLSGADWRASEAARRGPLSAVRCPAGVGRSAAFQRQRGETGGHGKTR